MKKNGSVKFLRYMRNLFFLLLISVSSVWAKDVYSQRAQKMFSVKSGTIESIFKQIKRQSLYEFFYNTTEVDVTEKVSLIQTEGTLNEILEQVLRNKYNYSIKDNYILISQKKIAQSDEIKKIRRGTARSYCIIEGNIYRGDHGYERRVYINSSGGGFDRFAIQFYRDETERRGI